MAASVLESDLNHMEQGQENSEFVVITIPTPNASEGAIAISCKMMAFSTTSDSSSRQHGLVSTVDNTFNTLHSHSDSMHRDDPQGHVGYCMPKYASTS